MKITIKIRLTTVGALIKMFLLSYYHYAESCETLLMFVTETSKTEPRRGNGAGPSCRYIQADTLVSSREN